MKNSHLLEVAGPRAVCRNVKTSPTRWPASNDPALLALAVALFVPMWTACSSKSSTTGDGEPTEPIGASTEGLSAKCGLLPSGRSIPVGKALHSCNGKALLAHQKDGNVVLYMGSVALWSTNTAGDATSQFVMQADGNLVLYSTSGVPLWNSGTEGNPGAVLEVQADCNAVVYSGSTPLWASATSCQAPPPPPTTCQAGDQPSLQACMATIDQWDTLVLTALISYTDDSTQIAITNQSGKTITGANASCGLANNGTGSQPWITVTGSSNITFSQLQLSGPFQFSDTTYYANYQSAVYILSSASVTMSSVTVEGTYGPGVRAIATSNFTLEGSEINNTGEYGLQLGYDATTPATFINIQNNFIHNARVNGIIGVIVGGGSVTDNMIANNTFQNNHHHGLYDSCNGICPGGQIALISGTADLTITNNTIEDGSCDNCNGGVSGIELNDDVDLQITANDITNNNAGSVATNPNQSLSACQVDGNNFWYNGTNDAVAPGCQIFGNDECASDCQ